VFRDREALLKAQRAVRIPLAQPAVVLYRNARESERIDGRHARFRIGRPMKVKGLAVNLGTNFGQRIGRG
jgi:hypothetical protein